MGRVAIGEAARLNQRFRGSRRQRGRCCDGGPLEGDEEAEVGL